jgi:hypothetical protein
LENVYPFHLALSGHTCSVRLHYDQDNWGHSIVASLSDTGETVAAETLQYFMARQGIERCAYAKFNCEGAEFPIILNSPPETLRRIRMMLILYHCDLYTSASEVTLENHLHSAGFGTVIRNKRAKRGWLIAVRD